MRKLETEESGISINVIQQAEWFRYLPTVIFNHTIDIAQAPIGNHRQVRYSAQQWEHKFKRNSRRRIRLIEGHEKFRLQSNLQKGSSLFV
jgi:hypothetical protein